MKSCLRYNAIKLWHSVKIVTKLLPNCHHIIFWGLVPASRIVILNGILSVSSNVNIKWKQYKSLYDVDILFPFVQHTLLYPSLQWSSKGVYRFHLVRPSEMSFRLAVPSAGRLPVCLWTESCLLCIFHNTLRINFIFTRLINNFRRCVACWAFAPPHPWPQAWTLYTCRQAGVSLTSLSSDRSRLNYLS